jgi:hypothetical protein
MDDENNIREEILKRAERVLHYNQLLIEQCDSWLTAEEGNRNMEKRIEERKEKEREASPPAPLQKRGESGLLRTCQ